MNIQEFVSLHQDISAYNYELSDKYDKVVSQAKRHTTRSGMTELQAIARPNEESIYTTWRESNIRHVTVDFILKFQRMLQRIINQSIQLNYEYPSLSKLVHDRLIPLSLQDTNSVMLLWVYMESEPLTPPSDPKYKVNQPVKTKEEIILSKDIRYKDDDMLIYYYDDITIAKSKYKRYVGVDKTGYYFLVPTLDEKKKITYKTELWYKHDLDRLPAVNLPGITVFDDGYEYMESVCWPAFEWFDEGIIRMSSEQVASIKHANPKLVLGAEIDCPTCNGKGYMGEIGEDGLSDAKRNICPTCKGNRSLTSLSDFSTIKVRNSHMPSEGNSNSIYYLEPPTGIKQLQDSFMLFFDLGKKSLANDILEGTGNESGIAKEMRLEIRQDLLQSYGQQLCFMVQDLINIYYKLTGKYKEETVITPPSYYETKSPEILKELAINSLQGERYLKYVKWVEAEYKGDEFNINLHKYAVLYAPLILYKADEFDSVFAAGIYNERDAIRRDFAFYVMQRVLEENKGIKNIKQIREQADKLLIEEGILPEEVKPESVPETGIENIDVNMDVGQLPDNLDELEEVLSAYVNDEIDRESTIKLVMVIEKTDRDGAIEIIDNIE